jgi:hypothetical protein
MSNDAIEGQPCHTENPIYCPIMFLDDTNSGPISKPILVFEDPPYACPFQSHDDPRNSQRQPSYHGTVQIIRAQVQNNHRSDQILKLEPI